MIRDPMALCHNSNISGGELFPKFMVCGCLNVKPVTAGRADTMGPVCCNYEQWDRYSIIYPKTAPTPAHN